MLRAPRLPLRPGLPLLAAGQRRGGDSAAGNRAGSGRIARIMGVHAGARFRSCCSGLPCPRRRSRRLSASAIETAAAPSPRRATLHGATRPPDRVAGGAITRRADRGAGRPDETVRVTLARGSPPRCAVDYPGRFQQGARSNGRSFVPGRPAGRTLDADGRTADARRVAGCPRALRLPVRRGGAAIGTAVFRLYAQRREGDEEAQAQRGPFGPVGRSPIDSSRRHDRGERDVRRRRARRHAAVRRPTATTSAATRRGGVARHEQRRRDLVASHVPASRSTSRARAPNDTETPSGDPILAADDQRQHLGRRPVAVQPGNSKSHIFVNRIAAGGLPTSRRTNVALPFLHGGQHVATSSGDEVIQDKPQMTIDNSPVEPDVWPPVRHVGRPREPGGGAQRGDLVLRHAARRSPERGELRQRRQLERPRRSSATHVEQRRQLHHQRRRRRSRRQGLRRLVGLLRDQRDRDRHVRSGAHARLRHRRRLGHRPDRRVAVRSTPGRRAVRVPDARAARRPGCAGAEPRGGPFRRGGQRADLRRVERPRARGRTPLLRPGRRAGTPPRTRSIVTWRARPTSRR